MENTKRNELEKKINARGAQDLVFRRKLLQDPLAAIQELGYAIPKHLQVNVREETDNSWELVLNQLPLNTQEISDLEITNPSILKGSVTDSNCCS